VAKVPQKIARAAGQLIPEEPAHLPEPGIAQNRVDNLVGDLL
jgi:hypothetical protein